MPVRGDEGGVSLRRRTSPARMACGSRSTAEGLLEERGEEVLGLTQLLGLHFEIGAIASTLAGAAGSSGIFTAAVSEKRLPNQRRLALSISCTASGVT